MKFLKSIILKSLIITPFLAGGALNAEYVTQYQSPGNLQVEVQSNSYNNPNTYSNRYSDIYSYQAQNNQEANNAVCYAIKHQKRLEMTVETQKLLNK